MLKLRLFKLFLLVLLVTGCSNDDDSLSEREQDSFPELQLLGEDGDNIYLYSGSGTDEEGSILNLSQLSGVNRQYITLRQTGDLVSFFSFASDNFSVVIHNVADNTALSYPNFYTVADERAITWGSNSEYQIFLGFYSPRGTRNYNVRIQEADSGDLTDIQIEDNTTQVFQPLYSNGRLVLPFRDSQENYKIAIVDTDTAVVLQILDFGSSVTSVFLNSMDELVVLSSLDQLNYQYNFYDLENASITDEGSFELNKFFSPGPLDANISDNKLYYLNFFAQPYPVTSGPAVFDLGVQEDRVIDILRIKQEIETEIGDAILLTDIHFLENANLFAIGYAESSSLADWKGGVVLIRPNGEKVYRIDLPFIPTYVVRE
ncbi:hypothetical protein LVD13_12230 [Flavobacteriaceae bacterium D16]|nr:hypothetical protein [Flavobacteriaceae bacterium D16]